MQQSILEMAKDLVMAQIQTGSLSPDDMQKSLQQTYTNLMALKAQEETGTVSPVLISDGAQKPVDWRKSITKNTVTCLECGAAFKQLSVRHLQDHGLDSRSYREKYGIPRTQPLSAKDTTARRKAIVQKSRPWEKAPAYIKSQKAKSGKDAMAKRSRSTRKKATEA